MVSLLTIIIWKCWQRQSYQNSRRWNCSLRRFTLIFLCSLGVHFVFPVLISVSPFPRWSIVPRRKMSRTIFPPIPCSNNNNNAFRSPHFPSTRPFISRSLPHCFCHQHRMQPIHNSNKWFSSPSTNMLNRLRCTPIMNPTRIFHRCARTFPIYPRWLPAALRIEIWRPLNPSTKIRSPFTSFPTTIRS